MAVSLCIQVLTRRYSAWLYWWTVVIISVSGTMVADVIHNAMGIPYLVSSIGLGLALTVVLVVWHQLEGTLSIDSISTRRRECLYWATVLVTFALGTATGDLTATTFGLGYLASGAIFAALFCLPFAARRLRLQGEVAAFWTAYILTRPLGASFADWMGGSHERGGLAWGTGWVSVALAALIAMALLLTRPPTAGSR